MAKVDHVATTSEPSVPVEQYHYGMQLDVAEVVSTTTPADKCKPSPVTLIYRDSQGHLKGLEYLVISVDCDSAGG